jgi:hypothetical protein
LQVMPLARKLADCVIPAEYGITPQYKLQIGHKIAKELVNKLLLDLENVKAESFSADQDVRAKGVVETNGGGDVVHGSETSLPAESVRGGDADMSHHGTSGDEVRLPAGFLCHVKDRDALLWHPVALQNSDHSRLAE